MIRTPVFSHIPNLNMPCVSPVKPLEKAFLYNQPRIESWFQAQWQLTPPPFMCSVDLRRAAFKLAPVDTNLYPCGFNNLSPASISRCIGAAQRTLKTYYPGCKRILIISENHTRNAHYFHSLNRLQWILIQAGYETRIGSLRQGLSEPHTIPLQNGKFVTLEPLSRKHDRLVLNNYDPCLIVVNNDFSTGTPDLLRDLDQAITPSLDMAWSNRSKTRHFQHHRDVANAFAKLIDLDAWLIDALFQSCDHVDFVHHVGHDDLIEQTQSLLHAIRGKYESHGIDLPPFAIIKADAGTYGMGVMTVRHADDLARLNRKQRNSMAASKGRKIDKVLIQEGVYTSESIGPNAATAECVVYMIAEYVVGAFYRAHPERGNDENLNAPGMYFEPLESVKSGDRLNRFYVYSVAARLALLAAAHEVMAIR